MLTLQNVVIPTNDFEGTVTLYRDILGLPVIASSGDYCFLRAGSVNLAIHVANDAAFAPTGHGLYLDMVTESLPDVRDRVIQARIPIIREWTDGGTPFLLIADPNGNLLEIYEHASTR